MSVKQSPVGVFEHPSCLGFHLEIYTTSLQARTIAFKRCRSVVIGEFESRQPEAKERHSIKILCLLFNTT